MRRFAAPERDGHRGVDVGSVGRAGLHVDAAGKVDGHDGDARRLDVGEHFGRVGSQRTAGGDADDSVDDQIGCLPDTFDDSTTGSRERGERGGVYPIGVEHDRRCRHAPAAQKGRRPQRVTAIVTRADHRADVPPVDAAGALGEFPGDGTRQTEGGPPHQRAIGEAG